VTHPVPIAIEKEDSSVRRAANALSLPRSDQPRFRLMFCAAYPLFLAVEAAQRLARRAFSDGAARDIARPSLFAEARENATIAISYASVARMTLQGSARRSRTERRL
jgi:hypothetical protein